MDEVGFEARGTEIQMRKKSRSSNERGIDGVEIDAARAG
jgi:hypothetical protein